MSRELAIDSTRLSKFYGRDRGVVDLDLDVYAGEIYGFLGPNGAGKSTTIHLLVGQIRPTSGAAAVLGLDCWTDRDRVARRVGFLPGEFAFYERLTGREMLEHLARLRDGVSVATRDALVERFEVELDRPIGGRSMGNKQKLGLVQAFMHDPELLILDEPTRGLDPLVQREFHRLVREVRDEGRTVFLSSHTLSEVERLADRVGIIREGALVEVAEVARLTELAVRRIDFELGDPIDLDSVRAVGGVRRAEGDGTTLRVEIEGSLADLMKLTAAHGIVDLRVHEADLEEVFLALYRGESVAAGDRP